MCIFSQPKGSSSSPPPAPAPTPVPTPSEVSPQNASDTRRKQLELLRYGLASTIKTGARGITGSGANLTASNQSGKARLGQ